MEKKNKKIISGFLGAVSFSLIALLVLTFGYWIAEPNIVGAAVATDDVNVNLNVAATISINHPTDVSMSPDITGTGSSTGSTIWTVTTNNSSGWKLEVETDQANTMHSGSDVFTDYTEGTPGTPESWSIANTDSEFGFGATGSYIETKFVGADKYMGFNSTTKEQVSHSAAETAGDDTTVIFKAEVGSTKLQPTGSYSAKVTATATTLP
ncbi:MAG: hypothetical protein WC858_04710 [Parcubacteria group bacterium]|jgi:hypothetical protein